ncbi:hypothetical protein Tco_1254177 [Tanacetum coccineum]
MLWCKMMNIDQADYLRPLPSRESAWINLLKKAGAGCYDLLASPGSAISPYLFALILDELSRGIQEDIPWCLIFADDIVLIAHDEEVDIRIGDKILQPKESFRYLGSMLHKSGRIDENTLLDMIPNGVYRAQLEVESIINKMRVRLRWFGHVRRRPQSAPVRRVEALVVDGLRRRGRPKLRWEDRVKHDMKELLLSEDMTSDRNEWRARIRLGDFESAFLVFYVCLFPCCLARVSACLFGLVLCGLGYAMFLFAFSVSLPRGLCLFSRWSPCHACCLWGLVSFRVLVLPLCCCVLLFLSSCSCFALLWSYTSFVLSVLCVVVYVSPGLICAFTCFLYLAPPNVYTEAVSLPVKAREPNVFIFPWNKLVVYNIGSIWRMGLGFYLDACFPWPLKNKHISTSKVEQARKIEGKLYQVRDLLKQADDSSNQKKNQANGWAASLPTGASVLTCEFRSWDPPVPLNSLALGRVGSIWRVELGFYLDACTAQREARERLHCSNLYWVHIEEDDKLPVTSLQARLNKLERLRASCTK